MAPQSHRLDHNGEVDHWSGSTVVGTEAVMEHPLWMLVPWAVFACAAAIKFWRLTALFRKHLVGSPNPTEQFRQRLERLWQKDQQAA